MLRSEIEIEDVGAAAAAVEMEHRPCPLGCVPDDEFVLVGRDRLHDLPGEFRIVRCRACGLMRTDPRPTPETIGFYYPDDYGPYQSTRVAADTDAEGGTAGDRIKRFGKRVMELNIVRTPELKPGRMLEIGCASGSFMRQMAGAGWAVEGIEFSEKAAAAARAPGYKVHAGALETAPDPTDAYDLVVGWMVLEHLHEPVAALRKLRAWTNPGGRLAISVPNAGSLERSAFGNAWFALHLPNHLYHYTPRTLAKVLDAGGWKIERIFHQRDVGNLVVSLGYRLRDRGVLPGVASRLAAFPRPGSKTKYLLLPLAYLLSFFGQTGRMTVWARRKDD